MIRPDEPRKADDRPKSLNPLFVEIVVMATEWKRSGSPVKR